MRSLWLAALSIAFLAGPGAAAWAADPPAARTAVPAARVAFTGSMGHVALLVIDGASPRALAVGATAQGVKLVSLSGDEAVVEFDGRRQSLRLGASVVHLGGKASAGSGREITLSSDASGHFVANGQINGRGVTLLLDTGATLVAMGQDEADRIGLAWKNGQRVTLATANGNTVGHRVSLATLRIGDVDVYDIEAVVQPQPMPFILLGNSFLRRFQMKVENDTMTLSKRY